MHPFLFEAWKEYVDFINTQLPPPDSKEYKHEHFEMQMFAWEEYRRKEQWFRQAETQVRVAEIKKTMQSPKEYSIGRLAITICPESGDHNTMLFIMEVVKTVSCIPHGSFVLEQRSEGDEEPYGWHIHATADSTYAPSKVKQFVLQKLKARGYNAFVCVKKCYNDAWEENYIKGNKFNALKDKKVLKDKELRLKYNLQDIYTW